MCQDVFSIRSRLPLYARRYNLWWVFIRRRSLDALISCWPETNKQHASSDKHVSVPQTCWVILRAVSVPVCRDPCVWAGGDHRAHPAAGQLPGHSGLRSPAALLSGKSRSNPSTCPEAGQQESAAWHWWWDIGSITVDLNQWNHITEIKLDLHRQQADSVCIFKYMLVDFWASFSTHQILALYTLTDPNYNPKASLFDKLGRVSSWDLQSAFFVKVDLYESRFILLFCWQLSTHSFLSWLAPLKLLLLSTHTSYR